MGQHIYYDFLNEFIDLCKKYNLPINEQTISLNMEPLTREDATRTSRGITIRETIFETEFTLKFKTFENKVIYEQEI